MTQKIWEKKIKENSGEEQKNVSTPEKLKISFPQKSSPIYFPLEDHEGKLLPIHFFPCEENEAQKISVLTKYLECEHVIAKKKGRGKILCAVQRPKRRPENMKDYISKYIEDTLNKVNKLNPAQKNKLLGISPPPQISKPCQGAGCSFFGVESRDWLCTGCFKSKSSGPQECKGPRCDMFGSAERQGYCSVCFKKFNNGDFSQVAPEEPMHGNMYMDQNYGHQLRGAQNTNVRFDL